MNSSKEVIEEKDSSHPDMSVITITHLLEYMRNIFLGKKYYDHFAPVHDLGIYELAYESQKTATVIKTKNFDAHHLSALINTHAWQYIQHFEDHLTYKTGLFIPTVPEAPTRCDDTNLNLVLGITRNLAIIWDWAITWKEAFETIAAKRNSLFPHDLPEREFQMSYPRAPLFQAWKKNLENEEDYRTYLKELLTWSNNFLLSRKAIHSELTSAYEKKPVVLVNFTFNNSNVRVNINCMKAPSIEQSIDEKKESKDSLSADEKTAQNIVEVLRTRILNTQWKLGLFGGTKFQEKKMPKGLVEIVKAIDKGPKNGSWIAALKEVHAIAQRFQSIKHTVLNKRKGETKCIYQQIVSDEKIKGLITASSSEPATLKPLSQKRP